MKRAKGSTQAQRRVSRRPGVNDLDLRALLDHLGRLLAQEYAALLTKPRVAETTPPREDIR